MTFYNLQLNRFATFSQQTKCIIVYSFLITPFVLGLSIIRLSSPWLFHAGLLFAGWLTWTFIEYLLHRFWTHGKHSKANHWSLDRHHYHHTHPTEIKVTGRQRRILLLISCLLIAISVWLNNYFTLVAGLVCGFAGYIFMHYFLHQKWASIVFPRLHRFHIYHHCKYPNHCHGISVPWWDMLFHTTPPKEAKLSERVINFYFGRKSDTANSKSSTIQDEGLSTASCSRVAV